MEVLYAEFNERAEAGAGSYSVTGDSLQHICLWIIETSNQDV